MIKNNDWILMQNTYDGLAQMGSNPNWAMIPVNPIDCMNITRDLNQIANVISQDYLYYSNELNYLNGSLFIVYQNGNSLFNPLTYGQIMAILKALLYKMNSSEKAVMSIIHPRIAKVSQQLFTDGHFSNAAEDAFIEINDRVKRLYKAIKPTAARIPDGDAVMTAVFSSNNPMLKVCDITTDTGMNEQKGLMFMLQGAMSALRNPKAHANITISKKDAMRRLIFASMLMYKIDEAVAYSNIQE